MFLSKCLKLTEWRLVLSHGNKQLPHPLNLLSCKCFKSQFKNSNMSGTSIYFLQIIEQAPISGIPSQKHRGLALTLRQDAAGHTLRQPATNKVPKPLATGSLQTLHVLQRCVSTACTPENTGNPNTKTPSKKGWSSCL